VERAGKSRLITLSKSLYLEGIGKLCLVFL
jgi:hypothetical protein